MRFRFAPEAAGAGVIYVDALEQKSTESITVMSYAGNSREVFPHLITYWMYFIVFPFIVGWIL